MGGLSLEVESVSNALKTPDAAMALSFLSVLREGDLSTEVRDGVTGTGGNFLEAGFKVETFATAEVGFGGLVGSTLMEEIGAEDALGRNDVCLLSIFVREAFRVVIVRATGFESSAVGLFPLAIRAMVNKKRKKQKKIRDQALHILWEIGECEYREKEPSIKIPVRKDTAMYTEYNTSFFQYATVNYK